jgi:hypothetical protein
VRTRDDGGNPIDTDGQLLGFDPPAFNGPRELGQKLRASPKLSLCMVTQMYRFGLGRSETAEDDMRHPGHRDSLPRRRGDLPALLDAFVRSDAFSVAPACHLGRDAMNTPRFQARTPGIAERAPASACALPLLDAMVTDRGLPARRGPGADRDPGPAGHLLLGQRPARVGLGAHPGRRAQRRHAGPLHVQGVRAVAGRPDILPYLNVVTASAPRACGARGTAAR